MAERKVWDAMHRRCYDERNPRYKSYGARGITVCERWHKFENFIADMGSRPSPGRGQPGALSLERIDNNGSYEPGNCRWGTFQEQSRNQRMRYDNSTGARGVYRFGDRWRVRITVSYRMIEIGLFDTFEAACAARREAERIYWGAQNAANV